MRYFKDLFIGDHFYAIERNGTTKKYIKNDINHGRTRFSYGVGEPIFANFYFAPEDKVYITKPEGSK